MTEHSNGGMVALQNAPAPTPTPAPGGGGRGGARTLTLLIALALLAPAALAASDGATGPKYRETDKRYEIQNAHVTVWFQGKKPLLKVLPTGADDENASYEVHLLKLAEFVDADGDHAYDDDEAVAALNLARADAWEVEVAQDAGRLELRLTLEGDIQPRGPGGIPVDIPNVEERKANVTLTFHVFKNATTIATPDGLQAVGAGEVKFDLAVDRWDWVDGERGRLALLAAMPVGENATAEASNETARVDVARQNATVGHLAWLETAEATTGNNTTTTDVIPTFKVEDGEALVSLAYNATGYDRLLHDPTVGVPPQEGADGTDAGATGAVDDGLNTPGAGALAALAVAAAAALARRRRGA